MGKATAVLSIACLATGCISVDVYQPLSALQRPFAVDVAKANFRGTRFALHCTNTDALRGSAAALLCRKVAASLEGQGASIVDELDAPRAETSDTPDDVLDVTLSAKIAAESSNLWAYPLVALSWSIFPIIQEQTIVQTIEVRDRSNFTLAEKRFEARFVRYTGIAYFSMNAVLNWLWRSSDENISEDNLRRQFSHDFYGQLSQTLFDARLRARALTLAAKKEQE